MATTQDEGLSDAEKEMLGNYRASLSPAPARKAKAWVALGSLAKAGAGTAAAGTTKLIVLSALSTATVLGSVGAWVAAEDTPAETSAPPSAQSEHKDPAPRTTAGPRGGAQTQAMTPRQPDAVQPDIPASPGEPIHKGPSSRSPATTAAQSQAPDVVLPRTLEAEARSLEKMRSALSAGRNARVLSLVSTHRMEFEHAVFAEEVDGVEVMASCRRSPDAAARQRLAGFASRYPASPQTPALRRACRPAQVPVQRPSKAGPGKVEK